MDLSTAFEKHFASSPHLFVRAPGRVNLLGEHVDYNDGPVLPAAIDRAVFLAASANPSGVIHLSAIDLQQSVIFSVDGLANKLMVNGAPLPPWALYPAGVAWALSLAGLPVQGANILYSSNIPIGAGLSSSAAVEVGFGLLWQVLGRWEIDRLQLARICQRAENEYVGVSCGLMDQFASACGVEEHALYFDTRSLEWRASPLPEKTALVIADSGVRRSLAFSVYNERRAACEQAIYILRQYMPNIKSLRDVKPTEFAAFSQFLPGTIRKRAEHVVKEIARVDSAVTALQRNDAKAFGALMYAGHASLRDLYEVSTPELDTLVSLTRGLPGCWGARLTGAGFGGCTVNLVDKGLAQVFMEGLREKYFHATGRQAHIFICKASQGATYQETIS